MGYSIKSIRQEFKDKGVFYTPKELSLYLKSFIDIKYKNVYDPTCGRGSLLSVFSDDIPKYGQELNSNELKTAENNLENFIGVSGDTLKNPAFMEMKFDCIIANPPFSVKWDPIKDIRFETSPCIPTKSRADYAFILHILYMLSNEGIAVVLSAPGVLYRGNREGKIRKWLIEQNYIDKVVYIEGKKFEDTQIATCLLVLKKNKKNTDILFIDNISKQQKIVKQEEIKDNDYCLSIHNYMVKKEEKKQIINPLDLEMSARKEFLTHLRKTLQFSAVVAKYENITMNDFIDDIVKTAISFKKTQQQLQELKDEN